MSVPPSVGDVLGAAGTPPTITHNGKTWKVGYPTGEAKDRLEKMVVADAWDNVQAALTGIPEMDAETKAAFHASVQNREYRTGGKQWSAAFGRTDGQIMFYLSLIREHHPEATSEDVICLMADKPDEFLAAITEVTPRFFSVAAEAMGLPKEKRAAWAAERAEAFRKGLDAARKTLQGPTTPSS